MSTFPKIDIIIPAYKAQDTILRTLSSIAMQEIVEDVEVTIVNDADGIGYQKFVDMFSPYMKIKEIVMTENGGPGSCRQYGYDNTSNPLVTFIDADDTFAHAFALKILRNQLLAEPVNACCFSSFLEDQRVTYLNHQQDSVWMFGKLYKRAFIDRYKIHFPSDSRSNEDNGFNMMCKLCANQNEQIKYIQDITYYWHFKEDSITRKDNANYSYNGSFRGYTQNMIEALQHAEKMSPFNGQVLQQKILIMCNLYEYWLETGVRDSRYEDQNWKSCVKYYKEIYRDVKDKVSDQILAEIYNSVMRNCYAGNKMAGIVPKMGFKEFLQAMEEEAEKDSKKKK